jgi:YVTN family beta-propeller protein
MSRSSGHGHGRLNKSFPKRLAAVAGIVLIAVLAPAAAGVFRTQGDALVLRPTSSPGRATPGSGDPISQSTAGRAEKGNVPKPKVFSEPTELRLTKAGDAVFDVRTLDGPVVRQERPERPAPGEGQKEGAPEPNAGAAPPVTTPNSVAAVNAPAPAPIKSFEGLDRANWGAGTPPDTNGDVGPTYYIETVNTSIGIYDKSDGTRVAAFTFNALMSQGTFGNLCDTNNFGDPVVLYDSFEDRWVITDFAFALDASGNVSPKTAFECFAVSKTGNPVTGGWNFYSILAPGGLADYPKLGVWTDGIYMSGNMFGYHRTSQFIAPHVWAFNKQQMYAGEQSVQVLDFVGPTDEFTLLPANARLQAGTPPPGTPEYFISTWLFLDGLTVYKLHVDWDRISLSTFTGPDAPSTATSWPNAGIPTAPTPGNALDTLQIRAMAQAQYANLGGTESLWVTHTVRRANTAGFAAPRWYQVNVTGGTVADPAVQASTWDPDAANVFYRFMPALAIDRLGDMALGYTRSNSTTNPQIKYAGRLAGDPVNTFGQTEQTLIDGTATQTGNCGGAACIRWGDYSGMALDPNGCTFWMTNEYYTVNGLSWQTRIGSFQFPGCTTVGNGTLSGTVSEGATPVGGVTIQVGSRTATTDASGQYTLTLPAGTYTSMSASKAGYVSGTASSIAVPDGATATRNFTLTRAPTTGCFTDNTQSAFQRGTTSGCDLTTTAGTVRLADETPINQKNEELGSSGVGITTTTYGGQTFTPSVSGSITKVEVNFFCSGCTGTTPNLTLSIRATASGLPTGNDLASGTITGFSSGASHYETATLGTPLDVTAGTVYAIVVRPTANPSPGTYALTRSGSSTVGADVYSGGQRVAGATSGTVWSAPLTGGSTTDAGFKVYIHTGFPSTGTYVSSLEDANPIAGRTPTWTTLSFSAAKPAGTDVKFQIAASNSTTGATNFVGPDGTANTFFTTTGASLSQFNGFRYLRYKAFLTTTSTIITPFLSSVAICFVDTPTPTSLAVAPATGTYGGTTTLSATLTAGGNGVGGESIKFTLNGAAVGTATTNASGVATLSGVSLEGINAGSYPTAVGASFDAHDPLAASSASGSLTVAKADAVASITSDSPDPSFVGQAVTVKYAVGVNAPGAGTPTGTVSVSAGADGCTGTVGAGQCSISFSGAGGKSLSVNYAGDANFNPSISFTTTAHGVYAVDTVSVAAVPTGVAVAAGKAYVANQGSNSVSVIDLTQSPPAVVATIPVGSQPDAAAASADGTRLYVPNFGSGSVSVIDTATNAVVKTVTVGSRPTGVVEVGGLVYVANLSSSSVSVFNPTLAAPAVTSFAVPATESSLSAPSGVAASANGQRLYVNDARNGKTFVFDLTQNPPVSTGSVLNGAGTFPAYLAVAGTTGFSANPGTNSIRVLDLQALTATNVPVGSLPYGVVAVPSMNEVFVTNSGSNTLTVIDTTAAPTVAFTIATGAIPDAIALSSDQQAVVVSNEGDGTLTIFHVPPTPANALRAPQTTSTDATASGHHGTGRISTAGTHARTARPKPTLRATHAKLGLVAVVQTTAAPRACEAPRRGVRADCSR